jgi:hypothetical protein
MHKKTDMWHVFSGCYFDDIRVLHIFPALLFGIHLLGLVTTYLSYHLSILDQQSELLYSTQFLAVTNFRLTILPQIWTSSRKSPENHPKITRKSPKHHPKITRKITSSPGQSLPQEFILCPGVPGLHDELTRHRMRTDGDSMMRNEDFTNHGNSIGHNWGLINKKISVQ